MLFRLSLHVVGNHVCLVVLCPETARRESRCPLYRVSPFSCTKSHKLKHNMARSHPIPCPLLTTPHFIEKMQCLRLKFWSQLFSCMVPSCNRKTHHVWSCWGLFCKRCESRCPLYCTPCFFHGHDPSQGLNGWTFVLVLWLVNWNYKLSTWNPNYKLLLITKMLLDFTNCYWLHYKLLLTPLQNFYWLHYKLLLTWVSPITNFYWLHYKLLLTPLQIFTDSITNSYWLHYKFLLTSLQTFTDPITNCYWLHYKLLLTSLQIVTDLITNFYWLHYKLLLTSLQTFTDLITNFYWLHYKLLLTSLQTFTDFITNCYWLHLQTFTDFITNFYWLHYKLLLTLITYKLLLTPLQTCYYNPKACPKLASFLFPPFNLFWRGLPKGEGRGLYPLSERDWSIPPPPQPGLDKGPTSRPSAPWKIIS